VALGLVHPDRVLTNRTGQAGDVLILTKALGVGVLSAAFKQDRLDAAGYEALIRTTTQLNTLGRLLPDQPGIHAVTDVTGFGLMGHAIEMAEGSGLLAELNVGGPSVLPGVEDLLRAGVRTGASGRNWDSYGARAQLEPDMADWRRDLFTDPQTSGGLLIAAAPQAAASLLDLARAEGFQDTRIVGRLVERPAGSIHGVRLTD
jgi:selenide,water dikinase